MRAVVVLSCLALAAATASAVPATLADGTAQFRAVYGASRTLAISEVAWTAVESPTEAEEDGEDEREDDERVPEGVLRSSPSLTGACLGRDATRATARRDGTERDPQNEPQRPPRA